MLKKIKLNKKSYLLFFQNYDFWNKMIAKHLDGCSKIDIITYNFNFYDYGDNSFVRKLCKLIDSGCCVRLLYSKSENNKDLVNNYINKFGIIAKLPNNHSKLFISDKVAFVGSSNFSFGSNSNLESGFFTTDKKIIKELRDNLLEIYYTHKDFEWISIPDKFPIILEFDSFKNFLNILIKIKTKFSTKKYITNTMYYELLTKKPTNAFSVIEYDIVEPYIQLKDFLHDLNDKTRIKIDNEVFIKVLNTLIEKTEKYLYELENYIYKHGIVELYSQSGLLSEEEKQNFYKLCVGNYKSKI